MQSFLNRLAKKSARPAALKNKKASSVPARNPLPPKVPTGFRAGPKCGRISPPPPIRPDMPALHASHHTLRFKFPFLSKKMIYFGKPD
jgi:hypothetical protein